jgi:hypothetical protein
MSVGLRINRVLGWSDLVADTASGEASAIDVQSSRRIGQGKGHIPVYNYRL